MARGEGLRASIQRNVSMGNVSVKALLELSDVAVWVKHHMELSFCKFGALIL